MDALVSGDDGPFCRRCLALLQKEIERHGPRVPSTFGLAEPLDVT